MKVEWKDSSVQQQQKDTARLSEVQRVRPVPFETRIDATGNKGQYKFGELIAEK